MEQLTRIIAQAAEAILDQSKRVSVRSKADGSPVTGADEASEAIICAGLQRLVPTLPIISEEQPAQVWPQAVERGSYFLVDPLDGTQEFVVGLDEYTINIALITNGKPLLGIICAPARGRFWRGIVGKGADRIVAVETERPIPIQTRSQPNSEAIILISRSHLEPRTKAYVDGLQGARLVPCGSSLKFCRIAEGSADHYPRLAPTRDWDVAAGQAILEAAGGRVCAPDGSRLVYGAPELRIPGFLAWGDPTRAMVQP
jgi:3'(2'), 5'-bisphosphate nucleotidase